MATPEQEVVFDNAVEGLFVHGMKHLVTPAIKVELRKAGIDLDRKLEPAYPRATWRNCLQISAQHAFPELKLDEAARQMGLLASKGYEVTVVGRAIIAFARVIGPRRTLFRMTRSLRSANTYVDVDVEERSPTEMEIRCRGLDLSPYFMGGIVEATLEFCRAQSPSVIVATSEGDKAVFKVSWRA